MLYYKFTLVNNMKYKKDNPLQLKFVEAKLNKNNILNRKIKSMYIDVLIITKLNNSTILNYVNIFIYTLATYKIYQIKAI